MIIVLFWTVDIFDIMLFNLKTAENSVRRMSEVDY